MMVGDVQGRIETADEDGDGDNKWEMGLRFLDPDAFDWSGQPGVKHCNHMIKIRY